MNNLPEQKAPGQDTFTMNSNMHLNKKLYKFFEKIKAERTLHKSFYEASIS